MKKINSNKNKHYHWLMSADMYFATTVILCKKLEESFISDINCLNDDQKIGKYCGFNSSNPDYELLMPIVFNLKHSIELYLKALSMIFESSNQYVPNHDLENQLNDLISVLNSKGVDGGLLKLLDEDIRQVINKYYYGTYAFNNTNINPDLKNEAERYPEVANKGCYKIQDLYSIVDRNLIVKIKEDAIYLRNTLRDEIYLKLYRL